MMRHKVHNRARDQKAFKNTAVRTRSGNIPRKHLPRGGSHL